MKTTLIIIRYHSYLHYQTTLATPIIAIVTNIITSPTKALIHTTLCDECKASLLILIVIAYSTSTINININIDYIFVFNMEIRKENRVKTKARAKIKN